MGFSGYLSVKYHDSLAQQWLVSAVYILLAYLYTENEESYLFFPTFIHKLKALRVTLPWKVVNKTQISDMDHLINKTLSLLADPF